jgi:hypothetical protein
MVDLAWTTRTSPRCVRTVSLPRRFRGHGHYLRRSMPGLASPAVDPENEGDIAGHSQPGLSLERLVPGRGVRGSINPKGRIRSLLENFQVL